MNFTIKDLLKIEVAPALGCTEPVAIALAAAAAKSLLDSSDMKSLELFFDPNIFKNAMAVMIPGTGGLSGLDLSAALGFVCGDAGLGLEVLRNLEEHHIGEAKKLIDEGKITVNLLDDHKGLFIRAVLKSGNDVAEAVIKDLHNNIASLKLNGTPVENLNLSAEQGEGDKSTDLKNLEEWLKKLKLEDIIELLDDLDSDDFKFLEHGVETNLKLSEYGLKFGPGLGIGKAFERLARQKMLSRDMVLEARMLTSAASDTRMSGVPLPAMSSAGSGNHGLTATLPIFAVKKFIDCDHKVFLEALALSHVITGYVKAHTGRLSAICGCSVAAGAGATAGITYLLGGNVLNISGAIKNIIEDLAGVICDEQRLDVL